MTFNVSILSISRYAGLGTEVFPILRTTLPVYLTVAQVTLRVVQAAAAVSDFTVLHHYRYYSTLVYALGIYTHTL